MSDKANKIERSELWDKIHAIVKQIPIDYSQGDAMDAASATTEIEKLFSISESKAKQFDELETIISEFYDVNNEISDKYNVMRDHIKRLQTSLNKYGKS